MVDALRECLGMRPLYFCDSARSSRFETVSDEVFDETLVACRRTVSVRSLVFAAYAKRNTGTSPKLRAHHDFSVARAELSKRSAESRGAKIASNYMRERR